MGVVKVRDKYGSGKGSLDVNQRRVALSRELLVWVDDIDIGPAMVLESASVPKVGDVYASDDDYDPGSWCKSVEATRDDTNEQLFHVVCEYDNEEPEKRETNPLLRPAVLRWSNRREEFYFPTDTRGNPYVTPAGVPIENPPPTPVHLLVLSIKRNLATYNPIAMNAYADAVNLDPFLGFPPGYAKIEDIMPSELKNETANHGTSHWRYYEIETVIAFRRIPWHPQRIIAKGRQKKNDNGDLVPTDSDGVMDDHEVYLDANGKETDAANYHIIERYPFPELSFAGLTQFTGIIGHWE